MSLEDVDMALGASMKTLTLPLPSQIEERRRDVS